LFFEEQLCNCQYSEINPIIHNTGSFTEEVIIEIEGADFIKLNSTNLTIVAGSSEQAKIEIWPPCDSKYKGELKVKAFFDKASAEDTMELGVIPIKDCYDLKIGVDRSISVDYWGKVVPVTVLHKGSKEAVYSLKFDSEEWISAYDDEFSLAPGETYSFSITASPDENVSVGNYGSTIEISTGNVVYQKKIKFNLREGNGIMGTIASFVSYQRYWFYLGFVLLVLLILLGFYTKERSRVWRIRKLIRNGIKDTKAKESSKKKADKKKSKKKDFKWLYWLTGIVLFAGIVAAVVVYKDYVLIAFGAILGFILEYIWYIIIGFLLLMAIIAIMARKEK